MKRGRPLVEGEPRSIQIKVRVTETMGGRIEAARGALSRQDWIRKQIEEGLK